MEIELPHNYTPRPYQKGLYNCIADGYMRAVAVWHRRSGKDKTMINIMAKEMFKRVGGYYYFFPTYKQGRKVLWNGIDRDGFKFMDHIPESLRKKVNHQEMYIEMVNGSVFQVIGTDNFDDTMGTNPVGCVFSEYALQKPEVWDFMRPILKENGGWAIFNFTPRGLNHGHEIYEIARRNERWFCELLTVNDTGGILTEKDINEEREEGMSENMVMQEYYCDFTASSDDVLIPLPLVLAASGKGFHRSVYDHAPKILGVDVARFGDDKSVIIRRQGLVASKLQKFDNIDNMDFASRVAAEITKWEPDAVFIDLGRGEGVIDRLRQLKHKVIGINFGGTPINDNRYWPKRSEMWSDMKEWLEAGGAIPDDQDLKKELSTPTYGFDGKDRMVMISKKKMKELGLTSPDTGDALALTFAQPVSRTAQERAIVRKQRKKYDPRGNNARRFG